MPRSRRLHPSLPGFASANAPAGFAGYRSRAGARRDVRLILVCAVLAPAGSAADPPRDSLPAIDDLPFQVRPLDSAASPAPSRPFLFLTPAEIASARARTAPGAAERPILDRLLAGARKHLDLDPRPLDPSWWEVARTKKWEDTYPEVYLHTCLEPLRMAQPASVLATAAAVGGDAAFAAKARALLLALEPYSFEFNHYDVGMNYSVWGVHALRTYDLLYDGFAPEERRRLDAFFTRLAWAVLRDDAFWVKNNIGGGLNNHLAWHKMMTGLLGLFYGRRELADYALDGRRGLRALLADGLVDDGLWCESSLVYHFAAIDPMAIFADAQRRVGDPACLYDATAANGRTLRQAFESMIGVLSPDGMIPPIGDAYGSRRRLWDDDIYEYAWAAWRDPRVAWLLNRRRERPVQSLFGPPLPPDPPAPPVSTRLYPEHGYAFLRSHADAAYWDNPAARCAFLTFNRSGVHDNADKLGLMLFGGGRMLLSDVEGRATVPHAFSSRIQRELNRGALSQNSVMIDGRDQRAPGELLRLVEFRDLPDEKRVTAADLAGLLYDGVRQMRTVCLTPDYVLDVFQVDGGDAPRQIDWIAHVMDEQALPIDPPPAETFALPKDGAWTWLRGARSFAGRDVALEWRGGAARLRLRMADPGAERVIVCGYPATDEADPPVSPMLIVRRRAPRAVFAALWLVGDGPADARLVPKPSRPDALVYEVEAGGRTRQHVVPRLARE